jgi:hypothetical protein
MTRQISVALILLLAVGYAAFTYWPAVSRYVPQLNRSKTAVVAARPAATPAPSPAQSAEALAAESPNKGNDLVDPFSARIAARKKVPNTGGPGGNQSAQVNPDDPKLEGIWVDSGMKVAFISGQAVNEGSDISGWKVVAIYKDYVVLQKDLTQKRLKMEELK